MELISNNTRYTVRMKGGAVDNGGYDTEATEGSRVSTVKGLSKIQIELDGAVFSPPLSLPLSDRVSLLLKGTLYLNLVPVTVTLLDITTDYERYRLTLTS